jgi:hypothetical protein
VAAREGTDRCRSINFNSWSMHRHYVPKAERLMTSRRSISSLSVFVSSPFCSTPIFYILKIQN